LGEPAHVTVLYPFIPPDRIHAGTLDAVAAVPAFVCTFDTVQWFGRDVARLAPDPDTGPPHRGRPGAVPGLPPLRRVFEDTIPHLTIGHRPTAEGDRLQQAAQQVQAALPAHTSVDRVLLIAGTHAPQSWHTLAQFTPNPNPEPRTPNPEP
jgi:hypothetical protein